jgi:hypothetical protein
MKTGNVYVCCPHIQLRTSKRILWANPLDYAKLRIEWDTYQAYDTPKRTLRFAISLRLIEKRVGGVSGSRPRVR